MVKNSLQRTQQGDLYLVSYFKGGPLSDLLLQRKCKGQAHSYYCVIIAHHNRSNQALSVVFYFKEGLLSGLLLQSGTSLRSLTSKGELTLVSYFKGRSLRYCTSKRDLSSVSYFKEMPLSSVLSESDLCSFSSI